MHIFATWLNSNAKFLITQKSTCILWKNVLQCTSVRPVGQAVKTLASHAGIRGSIPLRVIWNGKDAVLYVKILLHTMEVLLC